MGESVKHKGLMVDAVVLFSTVFFGLILPTDRRAAGPDSCGHDVFGRVAVTVCRRPAVEAGL